MDIGHIKNREQAIDSLSGYTQARKDELDKKTLGKGLVKSYLLETVPANSHEPDIELVFRNIGMPLGRIDETLYTVWNTNEKKHFGFLEKLIPRHPVIYTMEDSKDSDPLVKRLVDNTHELDRLWISGWTFDRLWQKVLEINPKYRYGRLAFEHQSIFEVDSDEIDEDDDIEETEKSESEEKAGLYVESRASRFTIVDKLETIQKSLPKLQENYYPLHSISQLRFPSTGRGGHDFYYNGKVINRSDSFTDHRAHLLYVLKIYKGATEDAEQKAWYSIEKTTLQLQGKFTTLHGAPVVMKFGEPISTQTFEKWIASTFQRKRNRFRLWGNPIRLGTNKVHVYGADRHLWQSIFLEITNKHVVAILPKGTCGNTIHRLVTNIQRYIDPGVDVWIGEQNYKDLVSRATDKREIKYEN
ncbi:hypothetical protein FJZ33_01590 [Candidatus Poribacteria bacterium]|nr:hypothetical protein [Candidatus Poribacteria bacterium]